MIQRIIKNIKWFIFNHPAHLRDGTDNPPCNYCGSTTATWHQTGIYCICAKCKKKIYDKILKELK